MFGWSVGRYTFIIGCCVRFIDDVDDNGTICSLTCAFTRSLFITTVWCPLIAGIPTHARAILHCDVIPLAARTRRRQCVPARNIFIDALTGAQQSQKTGKGGPPTNPATAPPQKFLSLLRYNLFMGVNKMRVKILPLLCRLGLGLLLTVRVSLVWFAGSKRQVSPSAVSLSINDGPKKKTLPRPAATLPQRCI